jgi:hypothetical protein
MKILIESHPYPKQILQDLNMPSHLIYDDVPGESSVECVGYYHNFEQKESVLILPKIFLAQNKNVFSNIPVHELAHTSFGDLVKKYHKNRTETDFIYRFSLILYLSLKTFRQRKIESKIVQKAALKNVISNINDNQQTALDLVLSLIDFHKEHKNLIVFTQKTLENQKNKHINWHKTINNTLPLLKNNTPIYHQTFQKQQYVSNEDELLRIFFSVLKSFKDNYGFSMDVETNYDLISKIEDPSVSNRILRSLKQLQGSYFNDIFRRLLKMLVLYFEQQTQAGTQKAKEEYVLCSNYNIVFEDMIDKLLSQPIEEDDVKKMKNLPDGKIIDHLFEENALFDSDRIYYIGDSKYYKETTALDNKYNVFKQWAYAKNIIQLEIDKRHNKTTRRYRDDLTEGYNPSPNFFIQGFIKHDDFTDLAQLFAFDADEKAENNHFTNRVFDRDTLVILHFKINFLFVLKSYMSLDKIWLEQYRLEIVNAIKTHVKAYYTQTYQFYDLKPKALSLEKFISKHFHILHGKIYRTDFMERHASDSVILGLNPEYVTIVTYCRMFIQTSNKFVSLSARCCPTKYLFLLMVVRSFQNSLLLNLFDFHTVPMFYLRLYRLLRLCPYFHQNLVHFL